MVSICEGVFRRSKNPNSTCKIVVGGVNSDHRADFSEYAPEP